MRRLIVLVAALGLAACSQPNLEPTPSESFSVSVGGRLGDPVILSVDGTSDDREVIEEKGSGNIVTMNGPILYSMSSFDESGTLLRGGSISLATLDESVPYHTLINGKNEGSRLTVANPQGDRFEIVVIDILYTQAWGEPVRLTSGPKVSEGDDGGPILAEPYEVKTLSTQLLRRGAGPQVSTDDTVIIQYSLYNADEGKLIDSSWMTGPVQVPLSELGEGLRTAIEGTSVGSRVMALLPASEGYGTYDAIVFIDLLALPTDSE